ncbi:MAG: hypothetical protein R6V07_12295 [Armatimonadota bacterium]
MSEREDLSRKLLEENGLREGAVREADREGLRSIVEAERNRGIRVSRAMVLSWVAFVLLLVVLFGTMFPQAFGFDPNDMARETANLVGMALLAVLLLTGIAFIFAIVTTVSWGLRMAFGPRDVGERLERIEAQLARMEAQKQCEERGEAGS